MLGKLAPKRFNRLALAPPWRRPYNFGSNQRNHTRLLARLDFEAVAIGLAAGGGF